MIDGRESKAVVIGRDGKPLDAFAEVEGLGACSVPSLPSDSTSLGDRLRRWRAAGAALALGLDLRGAGAFLLFFLGGVSSMTIGSRNRAC